MWKRIRSWLAPAPATWAPAPPDRAATAQAQWRAWLGAGLERLLGAPIPPGSASSRLAQLAPAQLLALDPLLRYGHFFAHWDIRTSRMPLPTIPGTREERHAHLFTAGCDKSGYLRQRALVALAAHPGRLALALALIRSDDWVSTVRDEAGSLLRRLLAAQPQDLFAFMGLLVRLRARERVAASTWSAVIAPVLADPAFADARWNATRDDDPDARLFAYSLVAATDGDAIGAACRQAVLDPVPRIALWALRESRARLDATDVLDIARAGLEHAHASVRADALRLHAELAPSTARDLLERALFDPSSAPRRVAAYRLREQGVEPLVAWRDALDSGVDRQRARVALLALAESATGDDAARIAPWLNDPRAPLRMAAWRALARAQPTDLRERLEQGLADPSRRVMRTALALLQREPGALTADVLRRAYTAASAPDVRCQLANCAVLVDKWDGLALIAGWADDDDAAAGARVTEALARWLTHARHRFTPLGATRREHLEPALARARVRVPTANWAEVDEVLRYA